MYKERKIQRSGYISNEANSERANSYIGHHLIISLYISLRQFIRGVISQLDRCPFQMIVNRQQYLAFRFSLEGVTGHNNYRVDSITLASS